MRMKEEEQDVTLRQQGGLMLPRKRKGGFEGGAERGVECERQEEKKHQDASMTNPDSELLSLTHST